MNNARPINPFHIFWISGLIGVLLDIFDGIAIIFNMPSYYHRMEIAVFTGICIGIGSFYALTSGLFRTRLHDTKVN